MKLIANCGYRFTCITPTMCGRWEVLVGKSLSARLLVFEPNGVREASAHTSWLDYFLLTSFTRSCVQQTASCASAQL
jgi:hypothetical protein